MPLGEPRSSAKHERAVLVQQILRDDHALAKPVGKEPLRVERPERELEVERDGCRIAPRAPPAAKGRALAAERPRLDVDWKARRKRPALRGRHPLERARTD